MRRLLTAFIIALIVHALILGFTFKRFALLRIKPEPARPVTMTFTYREPIKKVPQRPLPVQPAKRPEKRHAPRPPKTTPPKPVKKSAVTKPQPLAPKLNAEKKTLPPEPAPAPATVAADPQVDLPPVMPSTAKDVAPEATTNVPSEAKAPVTPLLRKARPLYRQNPPPHYPRSARRRGQQGSVVLEVRVLKDGTVGDLRILETSGHTALDKAALRSVRNWLFEPGIQGDQKIDMWVRVPIRFKIE